MATSFALAVVRPEMMKPLEPLLRAAGVGRALTLGQSGDGTLMEAAAAARPVDRIRPCSADDLAALIYSSGTTGKPKGAMLTHGNIVSNGEALVQAWGFSAKDRLLHALPLFHAHGLFVAVSCALLSGAWMLGRTNDGFSGSRHGMR